MLEQWYEVDLMLDIIAKTIFIICMIVWIITKRRK